jgi:hypothetical protein
LSHERRGDAELDAFHRCALASLEHDGYGQMIPGGLARLVARPDDAPGQLDLTAEDTGDLEAIA